MNEKVVGLNGKPIFSNQINNKIVHMLEGALLKAKAGDLSGAAIILVDRANSIYTKAEHSGTRHDLVAATVYLQQDLSSTEEDEAG